MCGFDELGQTPNQVINKESAKPAYDSARAVFKACKMFFIRKKSSTRSSP